MQINSTMQIAKPVSPYKLAKQANKKSVAFVATVLNGYQPDQLDIFWQVVENTKTNIYDFPKCSKCLHNSFYYEKVESIRGSTCEVLQVCNFCEKQVWI
jgi:hypothetical protein